MIMVSTDKAVSPRSIMGVSKRLAELALVGWSSEESRMASIRLGNVYGTEGSVVKLFALQILAGGFLKLQEALDLILVASDLSDNANSLIPCLGKPVKIFDLARRMIEDTGFIANKEIPITFIGLRPGDKITEDLTSPNEIVKSTNDPRLSRVKSTEMRRDRFDALMANLARAVDGRDLFAIVETLRSMFPEYEPSEFLLRSLEGAST